MLNEPFVSIVICTKNRKEALKEYALTSLCALDYSNYEVVILDDASEENLDEIILRNFSAKLTSSGLHNYF